MRPAPTQHPICGSSSARRLGPMTACLSHLLTALLAIGLTTGLPGCAIQVPQGIRTPLPEAPTVAAVQRDAEAAIGARVRWGGSVLTVHNRPRTTEVTLLARPLGQGGQPRATAAGEGRFIAVIPGFIDPAALPSGQLLTVLGRITTIRTKAIGEFPYHHPVVAVDQRQDWAPPLPVRD
jgi:outer membrane lipoprotein